GGRDPGRRRSDAQRGRARPRVGGRGLRSPLGRKGRRPPLHEQPHDLRGGRRVHDGEVHPCRGLCRAHGDPERAVPRAQEALRPHHSLVHLHGSGDCPRRPVRGAGRRARRRHRHVSAAVRRGGSGGHRWRGRGLREGPRAPRHRPHRGRDHRGAPRRRHDRRADPGHYRRRRPRPPRFRDPPVSDPGRGHPAGRRHVQPHAAHPAREEALRRVAPVDAMSRAWLRPVIVIGAIAARVLGFGAAIRLENLARLKQAVEDYGTLAPAVFIGGYILAAVFFVPGLPITVLGGAVFGPIRGTFYVWIAATIGASLAFLVARYALRGTVESWVRASPRLARIDGLVAEHGWRIVMLTRLVPLFPFNLQNYAYGITRIGFWRYAITSSLCIIPGTAAFTFAGGALTEGRGDIRRTLLYVGLAGVLLVLISSLPRWIGRRSRLAGDLLKPGVVAAILLASSVSTHAAGDAYAKLLSAHVRPGTVSGIRLALVDYRAVQTDPLYAEALSALARAEPAALASESERLAFWINAYNLLAVKAVLDRYPTASIRDGGSLLRPIWKRRIGEVGGTEYSLDEIEHR